MLLAIDVGNTNMVFGLIEGDALTGSFRLMTDANRTSDEIGLAAWDYFQRFGLKTEDVEDVIIASVVPQVMHTLSNAIIKYFNKTPIIVDDGVDPGLPYGVSGDERLGPDRAVDAVNQAGEYMGGCITAGVRIAADALFTQTAMLPKVELVKPDTVLGCTAVGQIQAGAVVGYIGAMEYLIREAKRELGGGDIRVVATGGLARLIADNTGLIDDVDPSLILEGLLLIYKRYKEQA